MTLVQRWYPWIVVFILALAGALAQIDRQIMGLLTEPVKQDLRLTDVEVSLLQGFAFVIFHSAMAFPLGYLSDRWPRKYILGTAIFLWSVATFACGLARNFVQLFLARLCVGVGEGALIPAAQSLLPDMFEQDRLPKAFAVFQTGILIGGGSAYVVGGLILALVSSWDLTDLPLLGSVKPWQLTFMFAAAPGPLIALLMFTIREPRRGAKAPVATAPDAPGDMLGFVRNNRAFLASHLGASAVHAIMAIGIIAWTPSFFIRTFAWTASEAGIAFGLILMIAGTVGALLGAQLGQYWVRQGRRGAPVLVNNIALAGIVPCAVLFPMLGDARAALVLLTIFAFLVGITSTMMPVILQLGTPAIFRGRMAACYVFASSAIGAGLGPVVVALTTDLLLQDPQRLYQAITLVAAVTGPLALVLGLATFRIYARAERAATEG